MVGLEGVDCSGSARGSGFDGVRGAGASESVGCDRVYFLLAEPFRLPGWTPRCITIVIYGRPL